MALVCQTCVGVLLAGALKAAGEKPWDSNAGRAIQNEPNNKNKSRRAHTIK
tara:strand:+ start:2813 stop:2965 length:153 start_codon:yes stop_codon:yes gene_type:complete